MPDSKEIFFSRILSINRANKNKHRRAKRYVIVPFPFLADENSLFSHQICLQYLVNL